MTRVHLQKSWTPRCPLKWLASPVCMLAITTLEKPPFGGGDGGVGNYDALEGGMGGWRLGWVYDFLISKKLIFVVLFAARV